MKFENHVDIFGTCSGERVEKTWETRAQSHFALMSYFASSCRCLNDKGLIFRRLKIQLSSNIIANFFQKRGDRIANLVVAFEFALRCIGGNARDGKPPHMDALSVFQWFASIAKSLNYGRNSLFGRTKWYRRGECEQLWYTLFSLIDPVRIVDFHFFQNWCFFEFLDMSFRVIAIV